MANDSSRSDKIQTSVAAALSRLRGDLSTFPSKANEMNDLAERREPHFTPAAPTPQPPLPSHLAVPHSYASSNEMEEKEGMAQEMMATSMGLSGDSMPEIPPIPAAPSMTMGMAIEMKPTPLTPMPEMMVTAMQGSTADQDMEMKPELRREPSLSPKMGDEYRTNPSQDINTPVNVNNVPNMRADFQSPLRADPIEMPGFLQQAKNNEGAGTYQPSYPNAMHEMNQGMNKEIGDEEFADYPPPNMEMAPMMAQGIAATESRMPKLRYLLVLIGLLVGLVGIASFWLGGDDEVTVIAADPQSGKVKPEPDQGNQVPNQDIQILESIRNPGQNNAQGAEILTPPPPPGGGDPVAQNQTAVVPVPPVAQPSIPSVGNPAPSAPPAPADNANPAGSPVAAIPNPPSVENAPPSPPEVAAPAPQPTANQAPKAEVPQIVPQAQKPQAVTNVVKPAAPAAPATKPTSKPVAGKASIQIGAVKSENLAAKEWLKLQKANNDILGKLSYRTEKVDKGGNILYRILSGPFADKASAQQACGKLKSRGTDCIVR